MEWVLIGPVGSFLFCVTFGLFGRWKPWRVNTTILRYRQSYLYKKGKNRSKRKLWPYEEAQQAWLRSCFVMVFLIILLSILIE